MRHAKQQDDPFKSNFEEIKLTVGEVRLPGRGLFRAINAGHTHLEDLKKLATFEPAAEGVNHVHATTYLDAQERRPQASTVRLGGATSGS